MFVVLFCLFVITPVLSTNTNTWGFNPRGTRYQPSQITSKNVGQLTQKWKTMLCGPITSSPSVVEKDNYLAQNTIFVGDFGGCLTAVNEDTGAILWQKNLTTDYQLASKAFSRNTPTYYKGLLVVVQSGRWGYVERSYGVSLLKVEAATGTLLGKRLVSDYNRSLITGSVNINDKGQIFLGLSSNEEAEPAVAAFEGRAYNCCVFGGRVISYNISNLAEIWNIPTSPPELIGPGLYAGGAVVGHPTLYGDSVYVSTANMYWVPASVVACIQANGTNASCVDENVNFNAVLRIRQSDGVILAKFRADPYDAWNAACIFKGLIVGCPEFEGADGAFIDSPVITSKIRHSDYDDDQNDNNNQNDGDDKRYVVIGQKTGVVWGLRVDDLSVVFRTQVGPGSTSGGVMYASTINDDNQIFAASTNGARKNWTTIDGEIINYGSFSRLSLSGKILWERPTPDHSLANAALSSTNDVVFGQTSAGRMVALSADCGGVKWKFQHNVTSSIAGASINKRSIYWGTGPVLQFIPGSFPVPHALYAFTLPASA